MDDSLADVSFNNFEEGSERIGSMAPWAFAADRNPDRIVAITSNITSLDLICKRQTLMLLSRCRGIVNLLTN